LFRFLFRISQVGIAPRELPRRRAQRSEFAHTRGWIARGRTRLRCRSALPLTGQDRRRSVIAPAPIAVMRSTAAAGSGT
jgi:hypothetical protein